MKERRRVYGSDKVKGLIYGQTLKGELVTFDGLDYTINSNTSYGEEDIYNPLGIGSDTDKNLYVGSSDYTGNGATNKGRIVKLTSSGTMSTVYEVTTQFRGYINSFTTNKYDSIFYSNGGYYSVKREKKAIEGHYSFSDRYIIPHGFYVYDAYSKSNTSYTTNLSDFMNFSYQHYLIPTTTGSYNDRLIAIVSYTQSFGSYSMGTVDLYQCTSLSNGVTFSRMCGLNVGDNYTTILDNYYAGNQGISVCMNDEFIYLAIVSITNNFGVGSSNYLVFRINKSTKSVSKVTLHTDSDPRGNGFYCEVACQEDLIVASYYSPSGSSGTFATSSDDFSNLPSSRISTYVKNLHVPIWTYDI